MELFYNGHHWEQKFCLGIPNSGASDIFPVSVVCVIDHDVAVFLELSFAVHWQEMLHRG